MVGSSSLRSGVMPPLWFTTVVVPGETFEQAAGTAAYKAEAGIAQVQRFQRRVEALPPALLPQPPTVRAATGFGRLLNQN